MAGETTSEDWKGKYLELQKTVKILTTHCFGVIDKHEEVIRKFNENKEQYDVVVSKLEEREKQLLHIRKLLEPVYSEYATLKEKYEIEQECRQEAEKYATQITKENRVLKRQSTAFLDKHDGLVPVDDEKDIYQSYLESLNAKITVLKEEKSTISAMLNKTNEDYEILKENHSSAKKENENLCKKLEQNKELVEKYKYSLQQVTSVSEAAYEEFESLKKENELANVCQNTAEKFASEMYAQSEVMKRQSTVLLSSAMSDERLMKALYELENLAQELETAKADHATKVKELEREISELSDKDLISSLESDNQALHEEREQLTSQLTDLRSQYTIYEKQHKTLESQYAELEKKYDNVLHPPPPLPPPLPPISVLKPKGFRFRSKRSKENHQKLVNGGAVVNENYSNAISEMLGRIKQGNQSLRPVLKQTGRRPSCPNEKTGAMEELHTMLNTMKRNRSFGDLMSIDEDEKPLPDSELKQAFQKIKKVTDGGST